MLGHPPSMVHTYRISLTPLPWQISIAFVLWPRISQGGGYVDFELTELSDMLGFGLSPGPSQARPSQARARPGQVLWLGGGFGPAQIFQSQKPRAWAMAW